MGKFHIDKDRDGQFRYLLVGDNGEPVLRDSQGHSFKNACQTSIDSVIVNAPLSVRYENRGYPGQDSFILKAGNGEIIGVSETYPTEWNRDRGIEAVKRIAPNATVYDRTLDKD